eukprot:COSAG02_NODE_24860_length_675_cov_1.954861_1_plen_59_part_10
MVRRDGTPWVGSTPAQRVAAWHKILADLQQHDVRGPRACMGSRKWEVGSRKQKAGIHNF